MSRIEKVLSGRWSGSKIMLASIAFGCAGVLPLSLYIAFGPRDGNPIGLGLLAIVAVPAAAVGAGIGLVKLLVQYLGSHGE